MKAAAYMSVLVSMSASTAGHKEALQLVILACLSAWESYALGTCWHAMYLYHLQSKTQ